MNRIKTVMIFICIVGSAEAIRRGSSSAKAMDMGGPMGTRLRGQPASKNMKIFGGMSKKTGGSMKWTKSAKSMKGMHSWKGSMAMVKGMNWPKYPMWMKPPTWKMTTTQNKACDSSPCKNSGICRTVGSAQFVCDCEGTGFQGTRCEVDVNECSTSGAMNVCPVAHTCVNTLGDYHCVSTDVCEELNEWELSCSQPYGGFWDALNEAGTFNVTATSRDSFAAWMETAMMGSPIIKDALQGTPPNYLIADQEELIVESYLKYLLDGVKLTPADFQALQDEFNMTYVARRLDEVDIRALSQLDPQCTDTLLEITVDVLVLLLGAVGVKGAIGRKIVRGVVSGSSKFGPAFAVQFVQNKGITAGFFVGAFITFFTTVEWWEIEKVIQEEFTGWQIATALLSVSLDLLAIYATGGWAVVAKIAAMIPSAVSLFEDVRDYLEDDCFGQTIVVGCEDYAESGGKGVTTSTVNMGQKSGVFSLYYEMYSIRDEIEVFYEGDLIYWSVGLVSGSYNVDVEYGPGDSELIVVRVTAPTEGTLWDFVVSCPNSS